MLPSRESVIKYLSLERCRMTRVGFEPRPVNRLSYMLLPIDLAGVTCDDNYEDHTDDNYFFCLED